MRVHRNENGRDFGQILLLVCKVHKALQKAAEVVPPLTDAINDFAHFDQFIRANVWTVGESKVEEGVLPFEVRVSDWKSGGVHQFPGTP